MLIEYFGGKKIPDVRLNLSEGVSQSGHIGDEGYEQMILTLVTWKSGIYQSQVSPLPSCQSSCWNAFVHSFTLWKAWN